MDPVKILLIRNDENQDSGLVEAFESEEYEISEYICDQEEQMPNLSEINSDIALLILGSGSFKPVLDFAHAVKKKYNIPFLVVADHSVRDFQRTTYIVDPLEYFVRPVHTSQLKASITFCLHRNQLTEQSKSAQKTLENKAKSRTKKLYSEILERKKVENQQKNTVSDLEKANRALVTLLDTRETENRAIRDIIRGNLRNQVMPYLSALESTIGKREPEATTLQLLKRIVKDAVPDPHRKPSNLFERLSPSELKIVDLIKEGKSTKEISEYLSMSPSTISSYRNNIRKKLGLVKTKTNLYTFLKEGSV